MPIIKDVERLRPEFKQLYLSGFEICKNVLGFDIRTAETFRDRARQGEVLAAGLSKNAIGKHEFGLAVDFDIYVGGVLQKDDKLGLYRRCGYVFMALGLRWGGNWDRDDNIGEKGEWDFRHVEMPKPTVAELIAQAGLTT